MVRKGTFKYIYIHGYDAQLFDLQSDPKELNNLVGKSRYAKLEKALRSEILNRFDPAGIEKDVYKSQAERKLMQKAMDQGQPTTWDLQPAL